jgi:hypothetical protein
MRTFKGVTSTSSSSVMYSRLRTVHHEVRLMGSRWTACQTRAQWVSEASIQGLCACLYDDAESTESMAGHCQSEAGTSGVSHRCVCKQRVRGSLVENINREM